MNTQQNNRLFTAMKQFKKSSLLFIFSLSFVLAAQTDSNKTADEELLNQYVNSKGSGIISFDASNIKQYWVDKSVLSKDNSIFVLLEKNKQVYESVPLKIQLMNVDETQDCKIEVITDIEKDLSFSVLNNKSKGLSSSANEDGFTPYRLSSSVFSLEKTPDLSFSLKFKSRNLDRITIKKIILSFSRNKDYLSSPGVLNISKSGSNDSPDQEENTYSFSLTGERTSFYPQQKILLGNNTVSTSVKVKNTGKSAARIYIGFIPYAKGLNRLFKSNYPYNRTGTVLNVISSEAQSNKVVVDSYPENWEKGCFLALNAEEDFSDIPNITLAGKIVEIKKLDDNQAEITLDKPLEAAIPQATKVRVHGSAAGYIYTKTIILQPGEEDTLTSTIQKDENLLQYSSKAFSRGVDYVLPLLFSYSVNSGEENTVQVSEYTISY